MATTTAGEEFCDVCGTFKPLFDSEFGYYRCWKCDAIWARDEDDPDYNESIECPNYNGTGRIGIEQCGECDGTRVHH